MAWVSGVVSTTSYTFAVRIKRRYWVWRQHNAQQSSFLGPKPASTSLGSFLIESMASIPRLGQERAALSRHCRDNNELFAQGGDKNDIHRGSQSAAESLPGPQHPSSYPLASKKEAKDWRCTRSTQDSQMMVWAFRACEGHWATPRRACLRCSDSAELRVSETLFVRDSLVPNVQPCC